MKFIITRKFILAKVEEKGSINLYTLLDVDTFDKFTTIGGKFRDVELVERETYEVEISIRMYEERFETKNGEKKYLDVANTFVSKIAKVGA